MIYNSKHQIKKYQNTETMKNTLIILLCFISFAGFSQSERKLVKEIPVPLSKPGAKGTLEIGLVKGSIKVQAYNGKEVIVKAFNYQDSEDSKTKEKGGMMRIPNNSFGLEITEEDNEVEIHSETWRKRMDFEILVPKNFDLKLGTVNSGDIYVEGISGSMEISNVNGSITLKDVSGSVLANTVNGKVIANFKEILKDTPMAFSSLNGKIDVTLPKGTKMTAKIKSDRGEIYSDFDMKVRNQEMKVNKSGDNYKKISINQWIYGDVNGGGAEMMFKNMHGNIYIRKAE
ncbi:MAG: hypothetical protein ACI81T_001826 [Bacteroidia bacterium]